MRPMPNWARAELASSFKAARYSVSVSANFPSRKATSPAAACTVAELGMAATAFFAAASASPSLCARSRLRTNPALASGDDGFLATIAWNAAAASANFLLPINALASTNGSEAAEAALPVAGGTAGLALSAVAGAPAVATGVAGLTLSWVLVCAAEDAARHKASNKLGFMRHMVQHNPKLFSQLFPLSIGDPNHPSYKNLLFTGDS